MPLCTLFAVSCILYAADVVYSAELQIARSSAGGGDISWDNSGDVVNIDEEECWRNNTPMWYTFSHLHTVTKVPVHLY